MKRAERLAAMLWPHRIMAIMVKSSTNHPKPRVELRSVVMTVDDEETPEDRLTQMLQLEDRVRILAHWDAKNWQGAPHYWRDYEMHHISSWATSVPEQEGTAAPTAADATLAKPLPHTFVARLLAKIGVHA